MKYLFMSLIFLINSSLLAMDKRGGHETDGGDIEHLRQKGALSSDDLEYLLANDGRVIKEKLLIPLVKHIDDRSKLGSDGQELWKEIGKNQFSFAEDIVYSRYLLGDCNCQEDSDMCTANHLNFASVCIDLDSIIQKRVNLAELAGLLIHEHTHHYVGALEHQVNFPLSYFVKEKIIMGKYGSKLLTLDDGLQYKNLGFRMKMRSRLRHGWWSSADELCHFLGYNKVVYYTEAGRYLQRGEKYWLLTNNSFDDNYTPVKKTAHRRNKIAIFKELECSYM